MKKSSWYYKPNNSNLSDKFKGLAEKGDDILISSLCACPGSKKQQETKLCEAWRTVWEKKLLDLEVEDYDYTSLMFYRC